MVYLQNRQISSREILFIFFTKRRKSEKKMIHQKKKEKIDVTKRPRTFNLGKAIALDIYTMFGYRRPRNE